MIEFNPDGSLKIPTKFRESANSESDLLKTKRSIAIVRELVSEYAPKKCALNITVSENIKENDFIEKIYYEAVRSYDVPSKLIKISDKEYKIEVGSAFTRCSDCNSLIKTFKDRLFGNVVDKMGTCTFKGRVQNFSYEDYFE
ncbi:MAG: hypothetical protein V1859_01100 [archaeon]